MMKFLKKVFERIFDFIENIHDALSEVPVVGGVLSFLFLMLCVGLCAGLIVIVGGSILGAIFSINEILGLIILLVGGDVVAYFASFKWGARKPWFFWVALALSVAVLLGLLIG